MDGIAPLYKHVDRNEVRLFLLHGADRLMPEITPELAAYGALILSQCSQRGDSSGDQPPLCIPSSRRQGVHLSNETLEAETIIPAAGIIPNPVVAALPVEKTKRGHIVVDGTMRCRSHFHGVGVG